MSIVKKSGNFDIDPRRPYLDYCMQKWLRKRIDFEVESYLIMDQSACNLSKKKLTDSHNKRCANHEFDKISVVNILRFFIQCLILKLMVFVFSLF